MLTPQPLPGQCAECGGRAREATARQTIALRVLPWCACPESIPGVEPGFYLKCGSHFMGWTVGFSCSWVHPCDVDRAPHFATRAEAERVAAELVALNGGAHVRFTVQEVV